MGFMRILFVLITNITDDMAINDKDEQLIALLRNNARLPVSQIARHLNVSRTAAQVRLEKLERTGVIAGYSVRLSAAFQKNRIRALVMIKSPPSNRPTVEAALARVSALQSLHSISGVYDLVAEISAPSVGELDQVIDGIGQLEGVVDTQSSILLASKLER